MTLNDNWRHRLFIYPSLNVLNGDFVEVVVVAVDVVVYHIYMYYVVKSTQLGADQSESAMQYT